MLCMRQVLHQRKRGLTAIPYACIRCHFETGREPLITVIKRPR